MSLVRYGTNVFDIDDVYGLDLYEYKGDHSLRVILRNGENSFNIHFETENQAREAFETICSELEVRDLSTAGTDV